MDYGRERPPTLSGDFPISLEAFGSLTGHGTPDWPASVCRDNICRAEKLRWGWQLEVVGEPPGK